MKKKLALSLSILILCFLGACNQKIPQGPGFVMVQLRIKGTVTAQNSSIPIVGAGVDLVRGLMGHATGTKTDINGQYSIECLVDWDLDSSMPHWDIAVTATGYESERKSVVNTTDWQIIDFKLRPNSTY